MADQRYITKHFAKLFNEIGIAGDIEKVLEKKGPSGYFDIEKKYLAKVLKKSGIHNGRASYDALYQIKLIVDLGAELSFTENERPDYINAKVEKNGSGIRLYKKSMEYFLKALTAQ